MTHVPSIRFGAITKAILKNPPRYQDYPFSPEEKLPPGVEVFGYRNKKAYEDARYNAQAAFRKAIDKHLATISQTHKDDPNYYAAAIPLSPHETLIVDGKDFDALGRDILAKQQHYLSAFETLKNRQAEKWIATDRDELDAEPGKKIYNWDNAYALGYACQTYLQQAERNVLLAYRNKATQTLDITV